MALTCRFFTSLLILALVVLPANLLRAQDNDPAPVDPKKAIVGEWTINIERSVRENPANAGMSEEELQAQIDQGKLMAGVVTIEITATDMIIAMGQMRMESPYKVLKVEGDTIQIEANYNGDIRQQDIRIVSANTLQMTMQGQRLIVERKGAPQDAIPQQGPETTQPFSGPRPEGTHGLMCGEWDVDLTKTLRADPAYKDLSDDDLAAAIEFVKMTGDIKLHVTPDKLQLVMAGSPSTFGYKVLAADAAALKLEVTDANGTTAESIWKVEPKAMQGMLDGKPMFFTREKAPVVETAPTPTGGSPLVGTWMVDVDATLAGDPRFAGLTDEKKEQLRAVLGGMTGMLTWTITSDRFVEDAPVGKRDYAWKTISVEGAVHTIEMSDDRGNAAQTKLTLGVGGKTMSGEINGSLRFLKRK